jgi:Tfp pilus assembly protein PilO
MGRTRQWSIGAALLVVVLLAAGWFLLVSPKRAAAASLNTAAVSQEQANATVRTQIAALKAQAVDLPRKQARLDEISAKLPDNPALPSLIRALSDAADKANVELTSIAPAVPATLVAAVPTTVGLATPPVAVSQIPVALVVQGRFFQVEQFLSNLESLPRALTVTTFAMVPSGESGGAATAPAAGATGSALTPPVGSLTATIAANVYMAPAAAATPSPVATPPPATTPVPGTAATPAPVAPAPAPTTTTR